MNKLVIKSISIILFILKVIFLVPSLAYAEWEPPSDFCNTEAETIIPRSETETPSKTPLWLTLDYTLTPIVGADLMILGLYGYEALDDWLIPSTDGEISTTLILGRLAKFLLIEFPLNGTLMVTQHEVFGHGARAREFKLPVIRYTIGPFSGSTSFPLLQYQKLSLNERAAISAGGMEGTTILANRLRERWFSANRIDSREATLYLLTSLDQTLYIRNAPDENRFFRFRFSGHDVCDYIEEVNAWYGKRALKMNKIKDQVLIDFLDPFLYYSLYSLGSYVIAGHQQLCDFPMIPIGDYRYLPGARLALAPYGPEYQWLNYIQTPERFIKAVFRYGNTRGNTSEAIDLEITRIWTSDLLFLDTKLSCWSQPKLFTPHARIGKKQFGFAASMIARYQFAEDFQMMGQLGYKTQGFLQGEILHAGIIARMGILMLL